MYLLSLSEAGGGVNCAIAIASAFRIIRWKNSNWLACNGGHILLTKYWNQYLLTLNYVRLQLIANFAELKYNFLSDIQAVVDMEEYHLVSLSIGTVCILL